MGGSNLKRKDRLTALLPSLDGLLTSLLPQGSNEPKKQHNQILWAESRVNIVKPLLHVSTIQTLYPLASSQVCKVLSPFSKPFVFKASTTYFNLPIKHKVTLNYSGSKILSFPVFQLTIQYNKMGRFGKILVLYDK